MSENVQSIVVFGNSPAEERKGPVDAKHLIAGNPVHQVLNYYDSNEDQYRAGIWSSSCGKWHAFSGRNEFCHMLSGRVRLTDQDGNSREFVAGDAFVIGPEFDGTWEVLEDARKYYVIFEPK